MERGGLQLHERKTRSNTRPGPQSEWHVCELINFMFSFGRKSLRIEFIGTGIIFGVALDGKCWKPEHLTRLQYNLTAIGVLQHILFVDLALNQNIGRPNTQRLAYNHVEVFHSLQNFVGDFLAVERGRHFGHLFIELVLDVRIDGELVGEEAQRCCYAGKAGYEKQ